jgi:hypothetical protein
LNQNNVTITLELPQDLVARAQAQGLLDSARLTELLEQALRQKTWVTMNQTAEPARQAFREAYPNMTEEEAMNLIQEVINEVREETRSSDTTNDNDIG